jgi:DNA-binding CsgD family transcriptional regulator
MNKIRKNARELTSRAADAGVALLDLSLRPVAMDEGAASILAAISAGADPRRPAVALTPVIPPIILDHLRASDPAGVCPTELRFTLGNHFYVGRAYLVEPRDVTLRGACIVLHFERESDITDACFEVSRRYGLTDREAEALCGVASGLTSKEVALQMNISPSTVKTFLRLIMIKTGSANRAGIVAKLLACRSRTDAASQEDSAPGQHGSDAGSFWPD